VDLNLFETIKIVKYILRMYSSIYEIIVLLLVMSGNILYEKMCRLLLVLIASLYSLITIINYYVNTYVIY